MKKYINFLSVFTVLIMAILTLSACGGKAPTESTPSNSGSAPASDASVQSENTSNPENISKPESNLPFDKNAFMKEIVPVLDCLRSCDEELFGTKADFDNAYYAACSKDGEGYKIEKLYPAAEELPEGFIEDPAAASYYPVSVFTTTAEVKAELEKYMTTETVKQLFREDGFLEMDGKLYLCRGGRGYGTLLSDKKTAEYVKEENGRHIVKIDYFHVEYSHSAELSFEKKNGTWKLAGIAEIK